MAQVLAPILQTSASITMPYSSPDAYQNAPGQPHQQQQRSNQPSRNLLYSTVAGGTGYRGTSTPIAPYAFASTPQLRQDARSVSAPIPQGLQQPPPNHNNSARKGHPSHPSSSSDSTVSTSGSSSRSMAGPSRAKDDSDVNRQPDSLSGSFMTSNSGPDLSFSIDGPVKPSPGRYRRGAGRADSSTSTPTTGSTPMPTQRSTSHGMPPSGLSQSTSSPAVDDSDLAPPVRPGHNRANSTDDSNLPRGADGAKRYRRRSFNGLDGNGVPVNVAASTSESVAPPSQGSNASSNTVRPDSSSSRQAQPPAPNRGHQRQGSASSIQSSVSTKPHASNTGAQRAPTGAGDSAAAKTAEAARRHAPSPLSQPAVNGTPNPPKPTLPPSTALKQLAAVNEKEKGMKSRLRRAFSFGSAAELRRATVENNISAERARQRNGGVPLEEDDPEQAAIIAQQEAAGIGAGIYSGQGGVGSTDNISIQSAASSASMMLRKMGSGMKKGSKSIKGLFRPKSVIGVPAADGPVNRPSVGRVSMVTVEAERQKVNVNAIPHEQNRGGTGYPRLERNSIDAGQIAEIVDPSNPAADTLTRKSIVGNDRERAEILSSMKKGILKRNNNSSDSGSPVLRPTEIGQMYGIPAANSPGPHEKRNNDDYFVPPPRILNGSTRSLPTTPQGGRNISFSPRLQFHDAWSPSDYDRRGEIATCNRLTPMLAQQIKEELNSFKMEMEVHEQSKPHTHFF